MKTTNNFRVAKLGAALALVALQGCSTLDVMNFKPAPASGTAKGSVQLYLHRAGTTRPPVVEDAAAAAAFPGLRDRLASCRVAAPTGPGPQIAPVLVAIVPVLGQLLFELYMDKQVRDLEALKEASQASYVARATLSANDLQDAVKSKSCYVIVRQADDDPVPAFVAVLALAPALPTAADQSASAFTFQPIYVSARSAMAVTRDGAEPKISAAVAMTMKSIGKQDNGLPNMAPVGEAATSVPGLLLGKHAADTGENCVKKACPQSDPIPLLAGSFPVVLGIAVSEKGEVGIDFDAASNELSAIKAAFGPVVGDLLKAKLEK